MNKSDLKVEITREEFENFKMYQFFYTAFSIENKDSLVCFNRVFDSEYTGLHPYQEIYYCTEALDKIESVELTKKQMELDGLIITNNILRDKIDRLKNRSLIERILNK